jgi:rfaE bifunctional protein nucleotidyltransferase chain/domain
MGSSSVSNHHYKLFREAIRRASHDAPIVFTNGCFDLLHAGHLETLRRAWSLAQDVGGIVVVGINSDMSVRRLKGAGRPIINEYFRREMLEELRSVDYVVVFDEDTPKELIEVLQPVYVVKGGDYMGHHEDIVGSDVSEIKLARHIPGLSTTKIIEKIRGNS